MPRRCRGLTRNHPVSRCFRFTVVEGFRRRSKWDKRKMYLTLYLMVLAHGAWHFWLWGTRTNKRVVFGPLGFVEATLYNKEPRQVVLVYEVQAGRFRSFVAVLAAWQAWSLSFCWAAGDSRHPKAAMLKLLKSFYVFQTRQGAFVVVLSR